MIVIEEKKEHFEKTKEKIYSRKKLDVFELRRRIETGKSLGLLKSDIQSALESGQISIDTYHDALEAMDHGSKNRITIEPEYTLDPTGIPFAHHPLTAYFENQKLGKNPLTDLAGFTY